MTGNIVRDTFVVVVVVLNVLYIYGENDEQLFN